MMDVVWSGRLVFAQCLQISGRIGASDSVEKLPGVPPTGQNQEA